MPVDSKNKEALIKYLLSGTKDANSDFYTEVSEEFLELNAFDVPFVNAKSFTNFVLDLKTLAEQNEEYLELVASFVRSLLLSFISRKAIIKYDIQLILTATSFAFNDSEVNVCDFILENMSSEDVINLIGVSAPAARIAQAKWIEQELSMMNISFARILLMKLLSQKVEDDVSRAWNSQQIDHIISVFGLHNLVVSGRNINLPVVVLLNEHPAYKENLMELITAPTFRTFLEIFSLLSTPLPGWSNLYIDDSQKFFTEKMLLEARYYLYTGLNPNSTSLHVVLSHALDSQIPLPDWAMYTNALIGWDKNDGRLIGGIKPQELFLVFKTLSHHRLGPEMPVIDSAGDFINFLITSRKDIPVSACWSYLLNDLNFMREIAPLDLMSVLDKAIYPPVITELLRLITYGCVNGTAKQLEEVIIKLYTLPKHAAHFFNLIVKADLLSDWPIDKLAHIGILLAENGLPSDDRTMFEGSLRSITTIMYSLQAKLRSQKVTQELFASTLGFLEAILRGVVAGDEELIFIRQLLKSVQHDKAMQMQVLEVAALSADPDFMLQAIDEIKDVEALAESATEVVFGLILEGAVNKNSTQLIESFVKSARFATFATIKRIDKLLAGPTRELVTKRFGLTDIAQISDFKFSKPKDLKSAITHAFLAAKIYNEKFLEEHPGLRPQNKESSQLSVAEMASSLKAAYEYLRDEEIPVVSMDNAIRKIRGLILDKFLPEGNTSSMSQAQEFITKNHERLVKEGSTPEEVMAYFSDPKDELYGPAWRYLHRFSEDRQALVFLEDKLIQPEELSEHNFYDVPASTMRATADILRYLLSLADDPKHLESRADIYENTVLQCSANQREYARVGELEEDVSCGPGSLGRFISVLSSHPYFRGEQWQEVQHQTRNIIAALVGEHLNAMFDRGIRSEEINAKEINDQMLHLVEVMCGISERTIAMAANGEPIALKIQGLYTDKMLQERNAVLGAKYARVEDLYQEVDRHMQGKKFKHDRIYEELTEEDKLYIRAIFYRVDEELNTLIMERYATLNEKVRGATELESTIKQMNRLLTNPLAYTSLTTNRSDAERNNRLVFKQHARVIFGKLAKKEHITNADTDQIIETLLIKYMSEYYAQKKPVTLLQCEEDLAATLKITRVNRSRPGS